jgi:predicted Zn-dependent protease
MSLAFVACLAACATNPVSGRRELSFMSEAQEIAIGQQSDAEIRAEMGVYDNPELQRYVSDVGSRLAALSHRPNLPWTFTVVDHPAVNAFALPGGYIYITRGILPYLDNEAELAGVLGHEIGHVTARHAAQQYTRASDSPSSASSSPPRSRSATSRRLR